MTFLEPTLHFARALTFLVLATLPCAALAQMATPRTLPELKAGVGERDSRHVCPVSELDPAEVREALGSLKSLDRDFAWRAP